MTGVKKDPVEIVEELPAKEANAEEVSARNKVSTLAKELKETYDNLNEDNRISDDTKLELNEKFKAMSKDNAELGDMIRVKIISTCTLKPEF